MNANFAPSSISFRRPVHLALRGLSSPATSPQGNRFGMIGMAIAVATTLLWLPAGISSAGCSAASPSAAASAPGHRAQDRR
jgi:hypothetical protein